MKITGSPHKMVWIEFDPGEADRIYAALSLYSLSAVEHIRPIASQLAQVVGNGNTQFILNPTERLVLEDALQVAN